MSNKSKGIAAFILFLAMPLVAFCVAAPAHAADLQPETLKAWECLRGNNRERIGKEFSSQKGFLALDFQDSPESAQGTAGGAFGEDSDQADAD